MGWELRHGGRWYLYRNRRVNGKPRKEYLAAGEDPLVPGFGALMAHHLARLQSRQAKLRRLTRKARTTFRDRIDELLAETEGANAEIRTVADGLMRSLGYHKHHRGEWRMKRDLALLKDALDQLKNQLAGPAPMVKYDAPADDAEAVEVFARARAGDAAAVEQVHRLIRDRKWQTWLGDLGRQATRQLTRKAAGGDAVWAAGIAEKAESLRQELLGEKPSVLEELLVRRVVNGWVAVHALELELTVRTPTAPRDRAHLDAALSRAQKRLAEAVRELARVRKLQAPTILAQLNVVAHGTSSPKA